MIKNGHTIKVLDKGHVSLVMSMGTDEDFVRAARQSTDGGFVSWEPYDKHPDGDAGLLDFLYRHHHATPFEMGDMVIGVKLPIMCVREWHRSRTQSYNEMSGRYIQLPNEQYVPDSSRFAPVASKNKQARSVIVPPSDISEVDWRSRIESDQVKNYDTYETMIKAGVPKEVARVNTPVSQYTVMWAKANIRNWFHFLNLRMRPNAQKEIRLYANAVASIIQELWPRTYELFEEYDLYGVHLSRTEMKLLASLLDESSVGKLAAAGKELGVRGTKMQELMDKLFRGGTEIL